MPHVDSEVIKGTEIILKLVSVSFAYTKHSPPILDKLDLSIQKGKLIGIAGPNGVGKTTLLKQLNGLLIPDRGDVYLFGQKVTNHRDLTAHVGVVQQDPNDQVFFPLVEDDVAFGLRTRNYSETEVESKVTDVLRRLKIEKLRHRSFFKLSFGEKKKVAFAGVLVTEPEILVLDEPTIGLDPWSKGDFLDLIANLRNPQGAVICATHDFELLQRMDDLYLLWDGTLKGPFNSFRDFEREVLDLQPHGEEE